MLHTLVPFSPDKITPNHKPTRKKKTPGPKISRTRKDTAINPVANREKERALGLPLVEYVRLVSVTQFWRENKIDLGFLKSMKK